MKCNSNGFPRNGKLVEANTPSVLNFSKILITVEINSVGPVLDFHRDRLCLSYCHIDLFEGLLFF